MNKKTREEIVAVDGFLPCAVCKSEFICHAFGDKGMLFLKNLNHVMQLLYKLHEIAKDVVMMEMQQFFEEWKEVQSVRFNSSLNHKRYLNINVHQDKDKLYNFGMVAISGRMIA